MVKDYRQAGFTLIEIMLTTAIASGLLLIVFMGQRQIRENAQFSDSVERTVASLVAVKNEANNTLNLVGQGDVPTEEVYGKAAIFSGGSPTIRVETLVASVDKDTGQYTNNQLSKRDAYSIRLPYGTIMSPSALSDVVVVYTREHITGQLHTYHMNSSNYDDITSYPGATQPPFSMRFENYNNSRSATVTIDPDSQSITRVFN